MNNEQKIMKVMDLITMNGKHANYQDLPRALKMNFYEEFKILNWNPNRLDMPRLIWILDALKNKNIKSITDIGSNSGFFSVELQQSYDATCIAFEPHAPHADALSLIKELCDIEDSKLEVKNVGVALQDIEKLKGSDLLIFLNVLHHAGDDFDADQVKNLSDWRGYSKKYLECLSSKYDYMFFQLGNAWKGSAQKLFDDQNFFTETVNLLEISGWRIESAGLIESFIDTPKYRTFSTKSGVIAQNVIREVSGIRKIIRYCANKISFDVDYKFLNRPIYLCKSLKK